MLHKHMKRGSASRVSVELQIKATMRHSTPTKKTNDKRRKGVLRRWSKVGTLVVCGGNCEKVWPLWETVWWATIKTTQSNFMPRYITKRSEKRCLNKNLYLDVYVRAFSYNIYKVQTTRILINRGVSKQGHTHTGSAIQS